MNYSKPEQLRFHAIDGMTVRADFEGDALSSDFGTILLRETENQVGLIDRLTGAINDRRHPSYAARTRTTSSNSRTIWSAIA